MKAVAPLLTHAGTFDGADAASRPPATLLAPPRRDAWAKARNLLAIRLDNLGDLLMTTPALQAIRAALPGCRLTLMGAPFVQRLQPFIQGIDDSIAYAAPWMKASPLQGAHADLQTIAMLRARRFDAAIIFTCYSQSPLPAALLCHLAGIDLRLAHCHENPYQLLTDWLPDPEPQQGLRHEVRRQLDLVGALGWQSHDPRLSFSPDASDKAAMRTRLAALGIDPCKPWAVLHPGASAASRRYPARQWAAVGELLAQRAGCAVVWTGSADEITLVDAIRGAMHRPGHSLAGQLTLGQFGALLALAPVLVCNNSGPVHLAAAVGTPVVDLYAMTNPQHTPWGVANRVLFHPAPCGFCYRSVCPQVRHICMEQIAAQDVVAAAIDLLHDPARPASGPAPDSGLPQADRIPRGGCRASSG